MSLVDCIDCGELFWREDDEHWKVRCYTCWKKHKERERRWNMVVERLEQAELQRLRQEVEQLNHKVLTLESDLADSLVIVDGLNYHLRFLIFAAHPDRNDNDPRANDATRWLLEMRNLLKNLKQE